MKRPHSTFKILYFFIIATISSCDQQQDKVLVTAPRQIVSVAQAKNMYDSYGIRRAFLIQQYEDSINSQKKTGTEIEKFDVGRFVYYDYKTIKQYLAYIEQEAENAGVEISTLRFYYSNYPDEAVFADTKDSIKHPRQNSILLSPTYTDGKTDHLFYIGIGEEGNQAIPLNNDFETLKGYDVPPPESNKNSASFAPIINTSATKTTPILSEKSLTLNRGSGVPPPKN